LTIDYPEEKLDRLTSFFRPIVALPILIILGLISGASPGFRHEAVRFLYGAGGFIFIPTLLMILFRGKYPKWWFDWNLGLSKLGVRVCSYLCLLRDEYPSTDAEQAVHLDITYPAAETDLQRGLPLIKWFLAIPHYLVLAALSIAAFFCVIIAWFSILFTARYPRSLFAFVVGVFRWVLRVQAYAFLLTTDRYPPFSLGE
ncbi:MAG TPA: DUF4389 domain-containing protein, partial [Spirochaetia bacterium]|nr:DUF4389 domain-containing protein [Spirochaetia bacterium]